MVSLSAWFTKELEDSASAHDEAQCELIAVGFRGSVAAGVRMLRADLAAARARIAQLERERANRRANRRPQQITGEEIWDSPEPSDLMVWGVCPYIQDDVMNCCDVCPAWEEDELYGKVKRGCRAMAEEACRVVMAAQRRETK